MGAHAEFFIPVTDYANLYQRISEEVQQQAAAATKLVGLDSIMQLYQNGKEKSMDALDNGAANTAARMDKTLADVQNLDQLEKSLPARDACTTSISGGAISNLACGDQSVQKSYQDVIDSVSGNVVGMYAKAQKVGSGITALVTSASTSNTATQTESQKNYAAYLKKQIATYDQIKAWDDAGKGNAASDPRLLMPMGNYNPQFSEEDLAMAQTYAYVTYPPYVRFNPADPTEPQEFLSELRMKNSINKVGAAINRQIEMRTPPSDGQPSKMTALEAETAMRFTDQGALDTNGESFLTRVTQDNTYTTSAINREGAIMKSIKLRQMIDRYESSLIHEQLLSTYVLNAMDNPAKKM
jgi:hypothetical protein